MAFRDNQPGSKCRNGRAGQGLQSRASGTPKAALDAPDHRQRIARMECSALRYFPLSTRSGQSPEDCDLGEIGGGFAPTIGGSRSFRKRCS